MPISPVNPEKDQDRVSDLFELFNEHNRVMFSQQEMIYNNLAEYLKGTSPHILEAGCGTGQGTAILSRISPVILGTDKSQRNVDFAKAIYPWLDFRTWDIEHSDSNRFPVVVCIEVIEHVASPKWVIGNLLEATGKTLWLSTPNGNNKPGPPENPYHVCEYTPHEILEFVAPRLVSIRHWETWEPQNTDTLVDPLVYEIQK